MRNVIITKEGKRKVTDREAFKHYRENAKYRDLEVTHHIHVYKKIIKAFYSKIARDLVNNDGGVLIKGLGYFSILAHPKKQIVRVPYQKEEFANFRTNNYLFLPSFFGIVRGNPLLNFWVMDRTFSRTTVKPNLHNKLISGKKYKTYISTLASLYLLNRKK